MVYNLCLNCVVQVQRDGVVLRREAACQGQVGDARVLLLPVAGLLPGGQGQLEEGATANHQAQVPTTTLILLLLLLLLLIIIIIIIIIIVTRSNQTDSYHVERQDKVLGFQNLMRVPSTVSDCKADRRWYKHSKYTNKIYRPVFIKIKKYNKCKNQFPKMKQRYHKPRYIAKGIG